MKLLVQVVQSVRVDFDGVVPGKKPCKICISTRLNFDQFFRHRAMCSRCALRISLAQPLCDRHEGRSTYYIVVSKILGIMLMQPYIPASAIPRNHLAA